MRSSVVDTYSNRRTLPQHLLTVEFYRLARSRLLAGGSLYVNFLAWPEDALFRTRAERTLRSVFAGCSAWPVAIEQGRGWHQELSGPGNLLLRSKGPTSTETGRSTPMPGPGPTSTAGWLAAQARAPGPLMPGCAPWGGSGGGTSSAGA